MFEISLQMRAQLSLAANNASEAAKRFSLFDADVEGAATSFRLYEELLATNNPENNKAMIYHASCFVCAVRRAGRLLESLSKNRSCFKRPVSDVIKIEWSKKRAFLGSFVKPRNAIEHIDREASDKTKWAFFNLHDDRFLMVVNGVFAEVTRNSLENLFSARDAIAEAIIKEYPNPALDTYDWYTRYTYGGAGEAANGSQTQQQSMQARVLEKLKGAKITCIKGNAEVILADEPEPYRFEGINTMNELYMRLDEAIQARAASRITRSTNEKNGKLKGAASS